MTWYTFVSQFFELGHAVLYVRLVVGNELFAVILADDLVDLKNQLRSDLLSLESKQRVKMYTFQDVHATEVKECGTTSTLYSSVNDSCSWNCIEIR